MAKRRGTLAMVMDTMALVREAQRRGLLDDPKDDPVDVEFVVVNDGANHEQKYLLPGPDVAPDTH